MVGSLNDAPFDDGYWLHSERLGNDLWQEIFNTDARKYGGWNIGNRGDKIRATAGALNVVCRRQACWSFAGNSGRRVRSGEAKRQLVQFPVGAVIALVRRAAGAVAAAGKVDPVFGKPPIGISAGIMAIDVDLRGKDFQQHRGSSAAHHQHSERPLGSICKP